MCVRLRSERWVEAQATFGAVAYHPNALGMRAHAKLIAEAIRKTL